VTRYTSNVVAGQGRCENANTKVIFPSGLFEKVSWEDVSIPTRDASTIPARIYKTRRGSNVSATAPLPVYLFFHGGGYLFGSIESEDANCSRVVAMSPHDSVIVVHVNYRHAPAFKYPVPHNDAWDAFLWLDKNITSIGGDFERVIVGGISAGGGLAASVVLRAQELPSSALNVTVAGQMLLIPWLMHPKAYPFDLLASKERSSFVRNSDAPILPLAQITLFTDALSGPDTDPTDIYLSTLFAPDEKIRGLPKTVFIVAGMDPLQDEALLYADKLNKNG
jgi:acetyl esterase/lipase